jgi:hypothetical protein
MNMFVDVMGWILLALFCGILSISVAVGLIESFQYKGVCVRCGKLKRKLLSACLRCNFKPSTNEDLAKQFILSTKQHHVGKIFPGKPLSKLKRVGLSIEGGKPFQFKPPDIKRVMDNF